MKRVDTQQLKWKGYNWRAEGGILRNGAFFVASSEGLEVKYERKPTTMNLSQPIISLFSPCPPVFLEMPGTTTSECGAEDLVMNLWSPAWNH
ncbi:probable pectate lyase 1 [Vigna radiata var. radiata]|uniref:Probable pectate lyase 1 n=1 Tax=Vigna radiata var. radiata TaxID=3916 RepID=A0A3Q0EPZ0_VIGRR|nr:probable pectate lyase 1 [Vigna radiata var. radiata]